jgi:uncharacterized membrane protein
MSLMLIAAGPHVTNCVAMDHHHIGKLKASVKLPNPFVRVWMVFLFLSTIYVFVKAAY